MRVHSLVCFATALVEVSVYLSGEKPEVKEGAPQAGALAWGSFEDGLNKTGWGILDVKAGDGVSDQVQHYAAGMIEGYTTASHIQTAYLNALGYVFRGNISKPAVQFLRDQLAWTRAQIKANPKDVYWKHVSCVVSQFDGLVAGYAQAVAQHQFPALDQDAFLILNGVGDLFQIMPAVDPHRRVDYAAMSAEELRWHVKTSGLCSALIKVLGDYDDLFMAHSSWFSYEDTDRIFKHFEFKFNMQAGANKTSYSSYPGYLESLDDFYMSSSGLGMIQTSNNVMNTSYYSLINPETLLAWQRVRISNAMATSGQQWAEVFRQHASGTYVNQYMLVDFKQFEPKKALGNGTLWVVEEMPGLVAAGDQTDTLRRGYWPSYNVPFYREVYERSGYDDARLGTDGMYELAPRAKIFRRDQGMVSDMASIKRLMRYANYTDPYAAGEGEVDFGAAICMRGDLAQGGKGSPGGCYDTKVTSYRFGFFNQTAEAVNGPTSTASDGTGGKSGNAPFEWRDMDQKSPHFGLPAKYDFDFIKVAPRKLPEPVLAVVV